MTARERLSRSAGRGATRRSFGDGPHAERVYDGTMPEQLLDIQRARILGAMFDVSCERGAGSVSIAQVVERAGVSRRTFYELFSDREECLLAAFDQAFEHVCERVVPAYEAETGWREQIRAGLVAFLSFLDEEPTVGRLLVVESAAGSATLARRGEVIGLLTNVVERGRDERKSAAVVPPMLIGEGIVGGVLSVIQTRLTRSEHEPLVELVNPLMSMIVLPYLGAAAARREIERSLPELSARLKRAPLVADPFKGTGLRLTYRTVRVLAAIGDHPGACNRHLAEAAEIKDQGQISKLLARLERAGMIANTELSSIKGTPNSWDLTDSGHQVVATIRAHAEGRHRTAGPGRSRLGGWA